MNPKVKTIQHLLLAFTITASILVTGCGKHDRAQTEHKETSAQTAPASATDETMVVDENTVVPEDEAPVAAETPAEPEPTAPVEPRAPEPSATPLITVGTETAPNPYNPQVELVKVVITSKGDNLVVKNLTFNRGNCGVGSWHDKKYSGVKLPFGSVMKVIAFCNSISEVSVDTDAGSWVFSF